MSTLPRKVAMRVELTGVPSQDRAQRLAQQVSAAHEQTKAYVATLATSMLVQGRTSILMNNTDQVIKASQLGTWVIRTTGAITAGRTLSGFPQPVGESDAYTRLIHNACTGGFNLTVTTGVGTTAAIGSGGSAVVQFSTAGAVVYVL